MAEARTLQAKVVAFETYDMTGVEWDDGVASLGDLSQLAWLKDNEGSMLQLDSGYPDG